jgi:hypothetical protein
MMAEPIKLIQNETGIEAEVYGERQAANLVGTGNYRYATGEEGETDQAPSPAELKAEGVEVGPVTEVPAEDVPAEDAPKSKGKK